MKATHDNRGHVTHRVGDTLLLRPGSIVECPNGTFRVIVRGPFRFVAPGSYKVDGRQVLVLGLA